MRKMISDNFVCDVEVSPNFLFCTTFPSDYGREAVAYATEKYFAKSPLFCQECTRESWQMRLAKKKKEKQHKFQYLIPAVLMELPGEWIRVSGKINAKGLNIEKIELLREYPCLV